MTHPMNYKTQNGLIKALERASNDPMTVKLAWWYSTVKYVLINKWGWEESDAAIFIVRYQSHISAYKANS